MPSLKIYSKEQIDALLANTGSNSDVDIISIALSRIMDGKASDAVCTSICFLNDNGSIIEVGTGTTQTATVLGKSVSIALGSSYQVTSTTSRRTIYCVDVTVTYNSKSITTTRFYLQRTGGFS